MTTTITGGGTTVTLSEDLLQVEEHGWSPIRTSETQTLTGALWVDVSVVQAGQPLILAGGIDRDGFPYGLMTRAEFTTLRAMADTAGLECTLIHRGVTYQVIWRHAEPPALDARDLIDYADPLPTDWVIPTLKFTRIA